MPDHELDESWERQEDGCSVDGRKIFCSSCVLIFVVLEHPGLLRGAIDAWQLDDRVEQEVKNREDVLVHRLMDLNGNLVGNQVGSCDRQPAVLLCMGQ